MTKQKNYLKSWINIDTHANITSINILLIVRSLSVEPKAKVYQSLGGLYFNTGRLRESYQMFIVAFQMEPQDLDIVCSYVSVIRIL